ncbi:MAG: SurA N-terminal domain-containing protein [Beggiatoa sp.]|nr:SurA N-terminal domain-containing protein [Beggiatoa sp.]
MLQSLRDHAHGLMAWIIVILISIPFALWGINEYFSAASQVIVAEINGDELELKEFQESYQRYRQQLQSLLGGQIPASFNEDRLKEQSLNQMVTALLEQQAAAEAGMRVGDRQISKTIQSLPAFQRDGKFARDLYERQIEANGMTPAVFEENVRRDLMTEQLRQAVAATAFVSKKDADWVAARDTEKRAIAYITLSAEPVKAALQIKEEDILAYYEKHRDRYMSPELVKILYLELSLTDMAKEVAVNDDALKAYYDAHAANFTIPEQRRARHVLIQLAKDASASDEALARARALEILAKARSGQSFETLASERSEDLGSKAQGGDLGFFGQGVMDPAFEKAVFEMKPGELSEPVRSRFGYHIIRLEEIKAGSTKGFDEARADVEKAYRREQAERQYFDQAEQLATLTFENPDTLEIAAKQLGLSVQESDFFPRTGGAGIAAQEKVFDAAFSPEVLEERGNSEVLELGDDRAVVLRVKEHRPAERRKLDEVRGEIVSTIQSERARAMTEERGKALLERLKDGEDRAKLAAAEKLEWKDVPELGRRTDQVDPAIRHSAFRLPRPAGTGPSYGGVALDGGDYALIAVLGVADGDPGKLTDKERQDTRERLQRAASDSAWQDFIAGLQANADIAIFKDKL